MRMLAVTSLLLAMGPGMPVWAQQSDEYEQARTLVNQQHYPAAEKALRKYAAAHVDRADALYLLGYVLFREDRPADSLTIYTKAAAITPPKGDDLKIVALDYALLDDNVSAIRWLQKAVELDAKNAEAWYFLGRAYYSMTRLHEAETAFQEALTLKPRFGKAENNLGIVYEAENRNADALRAYETAIAWQQAGTNKSEQPYLNYGKLLVEQNHPGDALPPLREAVSIAPNCAPCHEALGRALARAGKNLEAQTELENAVKLEPKNASFHYELGRVYQKTGDGEGAKRELELSKQMYGEKASPTGQELPKPPEGVPPSL